MESLQKAQVFTTMMALHHPAMLNPGHDLPTPIDFSPPALDLSRKRPVSPDYPYNYISPKRMPIYLDSPSSTICTSPKSHSGSENGSDLSASGPESVKDFHYSGGVQRGKQTRPFKAYPKDPLALALGAGVTSTETLMGKDSVEAYSEFRHKMLSQVQANSNGTNKNMRRNSQSFQNAQNVDPAYWEKRKKNNEAAKRSRDARRAKEDEIAIRCAFLEQENMQLKFRVAALESERERFQTLVYH